MYYPDTLKSQLGNIYFIKPRSDLEIEKEEKNPEMPLKLVILSSCHSEGMGEEFRRAGVPFVIVVGSDVKLRDDVALEFCQHLYDFLFDGKHTMISEAFESAKNLTYQKFPVGECCCSHRHSPTCKWFQFKKQSQKFEDCHYLHEPSNACKCPQMDFPFHELNCS